MTDEIGMFEAMHTQRAIRYFKPDPVPKEAIDKILEAASKAPSGTNRQMWHFVVVQDAELRARLAEIYRKAGRNALPNLQWLQDANPRILRSATHLIEHMDDAPVLLLACIEHGGSTNLTTGSSIYPAVQNILLAARGLGLGQRANNLPQAVRRRSARNLRHPRQCGDCRALTHRIPRRRSALRTHAPQAYG